MTIISAKEPADPELLWAQLSETAASDFNGGRFAAAAEGWENAYAVAQAFDEYDPRLAAGMNNLAITSRIKQNFEDAEKIYRRAMEGWESAAPWIDGMRLKQRARSSLFHLRMESKHRKRYDDIARRKYHELLTAGHAGTLNNLAELFHSSNRFHDAEQLYRQALRKRMDSMGEQEAGVAIINANLASLSDVSMKSSDSMNVAPSTPKETAGFISMAQKHGWVVDKPVEFTDEGRFMAAIYLTHLIDHTRLNLLKLKSNR